MPMKVEVQSKELARVTMEMLPCMAIPVTQSLSSAQQVYLITSLKNPVSKKSNDETAPPVVMNIAITHLNGEGDSIIGSPEELLNFTPVDPDLSITLKN